MALPGRRCRQCNRIRRIQCVAYSRTPRCTSATAMTEVPKLTRCTIEIVLVEDFTEPGEKTLINLRTSGARTSRRAALAGASEPLQSPQTNSRSPGTLAATSLALQHWHGGAMRAPHSPRAMPDLSPSCRLSPVSPWPMTPSIQILASASASGSALRSIWRRLRRIRCPQLLGAAPAVARPRPERRQSLTRMKMRTLASGERKSQARCLSSSSQADRVWASLP